MAIDIFYTRNVFRSQATFFLGPNIPSPMRNCHFTLTPSRLWNASIPGSERRYSLKKTSLRPSISGRVKLKPTFFSVCTYCSLLFIKCCQKKKISLNKLLVNWWELISTAMITVQFKNFDNSPLSPWTELNQRLPGERFERWRTFVSCLSFFWSSATPGTAFGGAGSWYTSHNYRWESKASAGTACKSPHHLSRGGGGSSGASSCSSTGTTTVINLNLQ